MIKHKILKFLIENKEKNLNINEISNTLAIDYKLTYLNVQKLYHQGLINIKKYGNVKICTLNNLFNEDIFLVESNRRQELLNNKDFLVLYTKLHKINSQFILIVFGSYAKGTATKHSDIDILLVSNKENLKVVESEIEITPLNIHLTFVSYEDFVKMLMTKEQTLVSEAIKKNIILFGVEDYYRILKNVGINN